MSTLPDKYYEYDYYLIVKEKDIIMKILNNYSLKIVLKKNNKIFYLVRLRDDKIYIYGSSILDNILIDNILLDSNIYIDIDIFISNILPYFDVIIFSDEKINDNEVFNVNKIDPNYINKVKSTRYLIIDILMKLKNNNYLILKWIDTYGNDSDYSGTYDKLDIKLPNYDIDRYISYQEFSDLMKNDINFVNDIIKYI